MNEMMIQIGDGGWNVVFVAVCCCRSNRIVITNTISQFTLSPPSEDEDNPMQKEKIV